MSTDTFSALETRLRSDLPRLADALVASPVETEIGPDDLQRLQPDVGDGRARRRGLVPAIAVAAVVLVLLGIVLAVRRGGDHTARPVDAGPAPVEAGWAPMATSPLSPREAAVSVWTGTEVIIWGGRVGDQALLDGAAYNPTTDSWRPIASNSWGHPGAHAVWTGSEMVVLAKNGGAAYDPATDTWLDLPLLKSGRGSFLAPVWTGQELLGVGVESSAAGTDLRLTTSTLAADGSSWLVGASVPVSDNASAVSDYSVVWTGTEAVVWNGHDQGWAYDPTSDTWRTLASLPTLVGIHEDRASLVPTNGGLAVVMSVTSITGHSDLIALGLGPDRWQQIPGTQPGRLDPGAQAISVGGDRALLLSTAMAPTSVDLSTGAWVDTDPDQEVLGGADQSAVWTGDELVVWGGADGSGQVTANGWRWHPGG